MFQPSICTTKITKDTKFGKDLSIFFFLRDLRVLRGVSSVPFPALLRYTDARPFLLRLHRNTLASGICELAPPTLAVRSLAMSPGTIPAYPQCHGSPTSSII